MTYHLVDRSPWPIAMSFAVLTGALTVAGWITHRSTSIFPLAIAIFLFIVWWRDIIREAFGGYHTIIVQRGILIGFLLFLLSEIMLFVSFFWAFFHSSLSPNIELAALWPLLVVGSL
jgi:cytochrome c oxidase subunit 3